MTMESLYSTVQTLKQVVEILAGLRGEHGLSKVYLQDKPPTDAKLGDLWVTPEGNYRTLVWVGTDWVPVTT
jgi:hypothetical protein